MTDLFAAWLEAKEAERSATEARRAIEDLLVIGLSPGTNEGSETFQLNGYKVRVTNRYNRKIDSDLLEEIAAENGIESQLGALFRWKPEIDMRAWRNAPEHITKLLAEAITTTAGRPSFSITEEE